MQFLQILLITQIVKSGEQVSMFISSHVLSCPACVDFFRTSSYTSGGKEENI